MASLKTSVLNWWNEADRKKRILAVAVGVLVLFAVVALVTG